MKKLLNILCVSILAFGLASPAGASDESLAKMEFNIVGVGVEASPGYQAVPKGINTQVDTSFVSPAFELTDDLLSQLPDDYEIKAELSGPGLLTPKSLTTRPGQPFDIQILTALGKYTLSNIRLVDGSGNVLFAASPEAVTIESIDDPIVTQVTTRELSVEELIERGVTFDSSNFTAYEFTAGIATESGQIPISLPVIIPEETLFPPNPENVPAPTNLSIVPPPVRYSAPTPENDTIKVPRNMTVSPFIMYVKEAFGEEKIVLPPIPGIVVIPGNIGFLHQYFSAVVMVTNGAPGESDLVVKDLKATIRVPSGEDKVAGSDSEPGDDPIRMAKGGDDFFPRTLPVMNPGPDGKYNTLDDISLMHPAETGQADFTIEGLKEGTHRLDFDITATLEGLPIGSIQITGKATGAVLVRNPDFTLTFGHPATVRTGEPYDLFITVTNTGKSIANLVSLHLNSRALSGAAFAEGEEPDKLIESIPAGASETVKYHLISQLTGAVTATAFESESIKGRFNLRTGVGENDIPLSPDSLILPYTEGFSADLIDSAVGLLGQAWSVATAPSGALPADITYITKKQVTNRAYDLSEAGLRVLIGDRTARALQDLTFDYFGSDNADVGFDQLRRRSSQGLKMNQAIANIFRDAVAEVGALAFQTAYAEKVSYRPGHVSIITGHAPIGVQLTDGSGQRTGGINAGEGLREIPYADQLVMVPEEGSTERGTLTLLTKIDSADYRLDLSAWGDASFDLGLVLPDAAGTLRQVSFAGLSLPAGARAWMIILPGTNSDYLLKIDLDGDGNADSEMAGTVLIIPDVPPSVVAATQMVPDFGPGGDKHGRNVAVLFSERVTPESAQDALNYAVEENLVKQVRLQPGNRMAFMLLRDGIGPFVARNITVSNLVDTADKVMAAPQSMAIRITAEGPAAIVNGHVRLANGEPVPGAKVSMMQLVWYDDGYTIEERYAIFSEKTAGDDGSFQFEYVLQNGDPRGPFMIEVVHPTTGERGQLIQGVSYHGQELDLDIFMKARGSVSGTVLDASGNPVAGADIVIKTLNDKRSYRTKADGSGGYSFSALSVGSFSLNAVSPAIFSEGSVMGIIPDDGEGITQDITIYRVADFETGDVSGRVIGPDGSPRKGIVVKIDGNKYSNWMYSREDGSFAFTGVYAGSVAITGKDYQTGEESRLSAIVTDGATTSVNLIMSGTGTVTGVVVREDEKPLDGIYVTAYINQVKKMTQTDAAGAFSFEGLPMGSVSINVIDPYDFNKTVASGSVSLISPGEATDIYLYISAKTMESGTIKGTVLKLDGTPWSFAEVRHIRDSFSYAKYKADAEGKFEIPNLELKSHRLAVIGLNAVCNLTTTLWYDTQVNEVELSPITGAGTVKGIIYDDADKTMPTGADVYLYSMKPSLLGWMGYDTNHPDVIKSDPQTGEFAFSGIYMGNFTVKARNIFRPTPVSASGKLTNSVPRANVEIALKGAVDGSGVPVNQPGSISGVVLMPDGTPAGEDIRVTTVMGGADITVTTYSDGHFQFSPIITAGSHSLEAEDPVTTLQWKGYVSVPSGGDVPVTIRLLGRGSITINALYADGTPVEGAEITVKGAVFPRDEAAGITGTDGRVSLNNLTEGKYALSVMGSFGRSGRAEGIISKDGENVEVTVMLAASGSVSGTFYKADGKTPVIGGQIRLFQSGHVIAYATSSSGDEERGQFTMDYIPLGNFYIDGFDPVNERWGGGSGRLSRDGETAAANVTIRPIGIVEGFVLNYGGTEVVARAEVTIVGSGGYRYSSVTAPDGSFIFAGVPSGSFTVTATDPTNDLKGTVTGKISYEGESLTVQVNIASTGSIEGTVYMPDGVTPVYNAEVNLSGQDKSLANPATGSFSYTNLPAEKTYTLTVYEKGTNRAGRRSVTIENDGDVAVGDISLSGIGVVEGTVYAPDGTPLSGAKVVIRTSGLKRVSYTDYVDVNGFYRFEGIPAGNIALSTSHPQLSTAASASAKLSSEGELLTVDMTFGDIASVTGKVMNPDGVTPATGAGIVFTGCGKKFTNVVAQDGSFTFGNLPLPCSYSLYTENGSGSAIGKHSGSLTVNGEVQDVGLIVLDDRAVTIASSDPSPGAMGIPIDKEISLTFSESVDRSTVNKTTVYLNEGSTRIECELILSSDSMVATLKPFNPMKGLTLYTLVATINIKDRAGRPLPETYTAAFTTEDNIDPAVISVTPSEGSLEVSTSAVVTVAFSESIDPLSTGGVSLMKGDEVVPVDVEMQDANTVALLKPQAFLTENTRYTVIVWGIKDVSGNVLMEAYLSTFDTLDLVAPVITDLSIPSGTAPVLGGNITVTAATPDTDVVFVDFFVNGELRGTDGSVPYRINLALDSEGEVRVSAVAQDRVGNRSAEAVLTMDVNPNMPPTVEIIYLEANASLQQDRQHSIQVSASDDVALSEIRFTASGAVSSSQMKTIGGGKSFSTSFKVVIPKMLSHGSEIILSVVAVDSMGMESLPFEITVYSSDNINPKASLTSPGETVRYRPGEAGMANLSATDNDAIGRVKCDTSGAATGAMDITLDIPASSVMEIFNFQVNESAKPHDNISLSCRVWDVKGNSRTVSRGLIVADIVPPKVVSTSLSDNAVNVSIAPSLYVNFDEKLDALTVNADSVKLVIDDGTANPVGGTATLSGDRRSVSFGISSPLAAATSYKLVIGDAVSDDAGNGMVVSYELHFTTDSTSPTVISSFPADGAVEISTDTYISVNFSEELASATISATSVKMINDLNAEVVAGDVTLSSDKMKVTFTPLYSLSPATLYRLVVADSVTDAANINLASPYQLTFATDSTPPVVVDTSPAENAVEISIDTSVSIVFSEPLAEATVNAASLVMVNNETGASVAGTVSLSSDGTVVTFRPVSPLEGARSYRVTVAPTVTDEAGNPVSGNFVLLFATDATAPTVVMVTPDNGKTDLPAEVLIDVDFSEPVDRASVTDQLMVLSSARGIEDGELIFSNNDQRVTFKPSLRLQYNTDYTLTIKAGITDLGGNVMLADHVSTFTTKKINTIRWNNRIKLTIDHTKIDEDMVDFPVLLNLGGASGVNDTDVTALFDELTLPEDRKRIEVTIDDGVTQCFVEIENWDSVNKEAALWVKVPHVSAVEDTVLYLYYDKLHPISDPVEGFVGDTGEMPSRQVWDKDFYAVYHMVDEAEHGVEASSVKDSFDDGAIGDQWEAYNLEETTSLLVDLADGESSSLKSNYQIDGDFEIKIDFSNFVYSGSTHGYVYLGFKVGSDNFIMYRINNLGTYHLRASWNIGGSSSWTPWNTNPSSGSLKLKRTGSSIEMWGNNGSNWSLIETQQDFPTGKGQIIVSAYAQSGVTLTTKLNNFDVISEGVIFPHSVKDSTSRVYDGKVHGNMAAITATDGIVGKGLIFDGVDDFIELPNMGFKTTDPMTFEATFNTYTSKAQRLISFDYGTDRQAFLGTNSTGELLGFVSGSSSELIDKTSHLSVNDGLSSYGVSIVNQTEGKLDLYLKGSLEGSSELGTPFTSSSLSKGALGVFKSGMQQFYKGSLDEVRISKTARSATWIKATHSSNKDDLISHELLQGSTDDQIVDADGDGLGNDEEVVYGTDPLNPDSDNDGLNDFDEIFIHRTDALSDDSDGDGLKDLDEVTIHFTNPLLADSDGDGLTDDWEIKYGLQANKADADGDGVFDNEEDTDGDGLVNKWEVCLGLDPKNIKTNGSTLDGNRDGDRDGWKNLYEVTTGASNTYLTNPCKADSDGDGVIDTDEVAVLGTDPTNREDLYGTDLTLSGGKTIRIEGKAYFNSLNLSDNSVITVLGATVSAVSSMELEVVGEMNVEAGSRIDVSGRGYLGGREGANYTNTGRTLGNTTVGGSRTDDGGSYGGYGGINSTYVNLNYNGVNETYGDPTDPNEVGSGGGAYGNNYSWRGGNGGGLVRIKAGTLSLEGGIYADGASGGGNSSNKYGGGSGGGIRIDAGTIAGGGEISANGGESTTRGGGGGGRIAVYYDDISLPVGNINAYGGKSTQYGYDTNYDYRNGGAGTVYLKSSVDVGGTLVVTNGDTNNMTKETPFPGAVYEDIKVKGASLVVSSGKMTVNGTLSLEKGSVLTHQMATTSAEYRLDIEAGELKIDSSSRIDVSGRGYLGGREGNNYSNYGRTLGNTTVGGSRDDDGGSYGGYGGINSTYVNQYNGVNETYGDPTDPNEVGSGGGAGGTKNYLNGGNGGGLVRIKAGTLSLEGGIYADGASGGSNSDNYGGGSGGGIRIDAGTIAGGGEISANGGESKYGGGGGGGRVAVYYDDITLPVGNINAYGGKNTNSGDNTNYYYRNGGAGTVYLKSSTDTAGTIVVTNGGTGNVTKTPLPAGLNVNLSLTSVSVIVEGDASYPGDLVLDNSELSLSGKLTSGGTIRLKNGSVLTHPVATASAEPRLEIEAVALEIDAGSSIDVSGKGYLGGRTSGNSGVLGRTVGNTTSGGSRNDDGGSYGGYGGRNSTSVNQYNGVNETYGEPADPNELGSGGGGGSNSGTNYRGGNGGGLVRIKAETITVNGGIYADGASGGINSDSHGGGSGGGIRIDTATISGSGKITANGASSYYGTGGGGGRVALYYNSISIPEDKVTAYGGNYTATSRTYSNGGAGTVYLASNLDPADVVLKVDNGGTEAVMETPLPGGEYGKVVITGGADVSSDSKMKIFGGLYILNNGTLTHPPATVSKAYMLDIEAGSVMLDSTSRIDASERGYLGGHRDGNGLVARTIGNVGGSSWGDGGSYGGLGGLYPSTWYPDLPNEVYGNIFNPNELGSGGGGYRYYCNGSKMCYYKGGNGGGLIRIKSGDFTLDGEIVADGGSADYNSGGGSGGGIMLDVATLSGNGLVKAEGGVASAGAAGGGGGRVAIYYDAINLPVQNISARGGYYSSDSSIERFGGAGTIYMKSKSAAAGDVIIDNKGKVPSNGSTPLLSIGSGTITAIAPDSLSDDSAAWKPGALKGLKLRFDNNQSAIVTVINNDATTLYTDISEGAIDMLASAGDGYSGVYILNGMTVKGEARTSSYDGIEIDGKLAVDKAHLILDKVSAGTAEIVNGGILTHFDATADEEHRLVMDVEGDLMIDPESAIDVTGKGYLGGYKDGVGVAGRTLGNTNGSSWSDGASYGGKGGISYFTSHPELPNETYGLAADPNELGSGGGGYYYWRDEKEYEGSDGGGLVRIRAGRLKLDGSIIADGEDGGYNGGGGSGGGVMLDSQNLGGVGTVSAAGGICGGNGGSGGGGRIAVYYNSLDLAVIDFDASGGLCSSENRNGSEGSVVLEVK